MGTPVVTALHRYPVKSFTPERRDQLTVAADGRIQGDRVLAFRVADSEPPEHEVWRRKYNYCVLMNTPGAARMQLSYDDAAHRLKIAVDGLEIADGDIDSPEDRASIGNAVTDYVLTLEDNPLTGHPERAPLNLVGDGRNGRFHDSPDGRVTLYSQESLQALGNALGDPELNGLRFRANVVISGVARPFEEFQWVGKRIAIGDTEFEVERPVVRCLATHANPVTGARDRQVMDTLVEHFGHEKPQFAVMLRAISGQGEIVTGSSVQTYE